MKPKSHAEAMEHSQKLLAQLKELARQHEQVLEAYEGRLESLLLDAAKNPAAAAAKRPAPLDLPEGPEAKRQRMLAEQEQRRRAIWDEAAKLLEKCRRHSKAEPFKLPVDPVKLKIPDYYKIITKPMDLSTVGQKLKGGRYGHPREFADDVRQIWANCARYNPPQTPVAKMGVTMSEYFEKNWGTSGAEHNWGVEMARQAYEAKVRLLRVVVLCALCCVCVARARARD